MTLTDPLTPSKPTLQTLISSPSPDTWTEDSTYILIEAYADRYNAVTNLRQKQWQEVAEIVNSRYNAVSGDNSPLRSDGQCRNKIDSLKRRYKLEKSRVLSSNGRFTSTWPFYARLEGLIGNFMGKKPGEGEGVVAFTPHFGVDIGKKEKVEVGEAKSGGNEGVVEKRGTTKKPSPHFGAGLAKVADLEALRPSSEVKKGGLMRVFGNEGVVDFGRMRLRASSGLTPLSDKPLRKRGEFKVFGDEGIVDFGKKRSKLSRESKGQDERFRESRDLKDEGIVDFGATRAKKPLCRDVDIGRWGDREVDMFRELGKAVTWFGEIYERVEEEKKVQIMELEKERMEFIKSLEFERMQVYMDTLVKLEKIKRMKRGSVESDK